MGQIERGERILSVETLTKVANALGVTVDELLHDSINLEADKHVKHFARLIHNRTDRQKQMAIDVVKTMFSHMGYDE